jgi:nucleoside-diphosphate-sugar epimerase
MKTVIILGAAGRIGDAAARAFVAAGWRVKGLARGGHGADLAPEVEWVKADAFDRAALTDACAGADVVLNALNPLYTEWEEKVLPMAENVIAAVEAAGATQLLPGNVYNYGYDVGLAMREDAQQVPSTPKARIRIDMETLFRRAAEERGVRTVVLRAGDFYGGTRPGAWLDGMILSKLAKDVIIWPGPMDLPHAFAYLPDLGRAFVQLAERREALPAFDTFHFEGHTLTGEAFKAATEEAVGRGLSRRGVPWILLRAGGIFMPMLRELSVMSYLWRMPHGLDGTKLRDLLGEVPTTEPVEAIRRSVADLGLDGRAARLAA